MLKKRLQAGKACVNGWLAIPSGFSAEVMSGCGWDSVTVDMQHGVQDYLSMVTCFQAMDKHPITPLVRVPWNEPGIVGKVLDGGAWGVICPMVNNRREAEQLVAWTSYPPRGTRSNGPIRAGLYGSSGNYQTTANDETLCIPMIDSLCGGVVSTVTGRARVLHVRGEYLPVVALYEVFGLKPQTTEIDSEAHTPMFERYSMWTGETDRSTDIDRSMGCPPRSSSGMIRAPASPRWSRTASAPRCSIRRWA